MSLYGPKPGHAPGPRPTVMNQPLPWYGWLIAIVLGLGLGIYFILEEERASQQTEQRERAGAVHLERAEPLRRDPARSGAATRESADILSPVAVDPPKRDKFEPLQSADIIH